MATSKVKWHGEKVKQEVGQRCFQAMSKACLLVLADAKRYCPVDTGRLRASLAHEIEMSKDGVTGRVGTNVKYGVYVEYGTSNPNYPKQPYLRPALEKNKGKIKQLLKGK